MAAFDIPSKRKGSILCSLLGLFTLFLFKDIIFGGHLLFGSDFVACYMSLKQFLFNEIHKHQSIPLWNPYIFSGIPFWAHFESTVFYPLDFLFWILPPENAYGYTMFIHMVMASVFMFILARSFHISLAGSFIAATVFTFNHFLLATLFGGQMFRIQAYIWIPLIIYFLNRAIKSESPHVMSALAGLFWGLQILSGSPQDAFYTLFASILFLSCNLHKIDFKEVRTIGKRLAIAGIFFCVGSCLSAIQIVPAFEFINQSVRSVLDSYELVTIGSYPPQGIVTVVMPNFFGNYLKGNFWVSGMPWTIPIQSLYVGILPIILLFFISNKRSDNGSIIIFALSLIVFVFVMALGSHTPVYKLVYHLPGFNRIRAPSKVIALWPFAFGLIAGKGMDGLFSLSKASLIRRFGLSMCFTVAILFVDALFYYDRSIVIKFFSHLMLEPIPDKISEAPDIIANEFHRFSLLSLLIVITILLWLRGLVNHRLAAAFLCVLLILDLEHVNRGAVRHKDDIYRWARQAKKDLNNSIGKDRGIYRVGSYEFGMGPNIEMYLGLQTVGGYNPLFLHRYYEYINKYQFHQKEIPEGWIVFFYGDHENKKLMDLLNVKYEVFHDKKMYVLRKTCLPRAFIVHDYKMMRKEKILDYLISPDFDPTRMVVFETDDCQPEMLQYFRGNPDAKDHVRIVSYRPDNILLETETTSPGYLFLSEIYYPGWEAFINGKKKKIKRGDYLFRVVELPKGHHTVSLVFDPLSIKVGIAITCVTVLLVAILITCRIRKRPRKI